MNNIFFIGDEEKYLSDIFYNNIAQIHEFNYVYISFHLKCRKLKGYENNIIYGINNDIDLIIKSDSNSDNYDTIYYYYGLLNYILKSELKFDIQNWIETRYFINVIKAKFFNYVNSSISLFPIVRKMLEELIDIMYEYAEDEIRDRVLLNFDLLEKELGGDHHFASVALHEDVVIDSIKQRALEKYFKNELKLNTEGKESIKENTIFLSTDLKENIPNIDLYKEIKKLLVPFIGRGTSQNYISIINNKKFSSKKTYLTLISSNKKDAILFAKTFNLNKDQLISVLRQKKEKKTQVLNISDVYFKSIIFNEIDPSKFERELFKVRNEYLNKINPKEFPLIALK